MSLGVSVSRLSFCSFLGGLTLKVGHVCPDIRVQGIDNHLSVGRTSDLDSAVGKAGCWWCALPCIAVADVLSLREEVGKLAGVELGLAGFASLQQFLASLVECAVEKGQEDGSLLGDDLASLLIERSEDVDLTENLFLARHFVFFGLDTNVFHR